MNFEQDNSIDNIIRLLEEDDILRNKYLLSFLKIMVNNGSNRIFSLNGDWGSGKTIFVKKLEVLIKYCYIYDGVEEKWDNIYSEHSNFSNDDIDRLQKIITRDNYSNFNSIIKDNLINCVYFNAWEHDDEEDPIISIIYELIREYNLFDETKINELNSVLSLLNVLVKNLSANTLDFHGVIKKEDLSYDIQRKDNIKRAVDNTIDELINEKCNKLIIFIDELDRCNPTYAVRLLERIKHYFTDKRIVIVVSTNLLELSNTISGMYGNKFSSIMYLDKFFDIRLELPEANVEKYIGTLDSVINSDRNAWFSIGVNNYINNNLLQLREINRYLGCIKFFENSSRKERYYGFERYQTLIDCLFLPYIIGLYVTNIEEYKNFRKRKGWEAFYKYIQNNKALVKLCKYTLYDNINNEYTKIADETVLAEVKKLYNLMFDKNYKEKISEIKIGNQEIRLNAFEYIDDRISILGDLSDFGEIKS